MHLSLCFFWDKQMKRVITRASELGLICTPGHPLLKTNITKNFNVNVIHIFKYVTLTLGQYQHQDGVNKYVSTLASKSGNISTGSIQLFWNYKHRIQGLKYSMSTVMLQR